MIGGCRICVFKIQTTFGLKPFSLNFDFVTVAVSLIKGICLYMIRFSLNGNFKFTKYIFYESQKRVFGNGSGFKEKCDLKVIL